MKYVFIVTILAIAQNIQAQMTNHPGGVDGLLAWFKTESNGFDEDKGNWVNKSDYNVGIKLVTLDQSMNLVNVVDYKDGPIHSINFNPGLLFGNPGSSFAYNDYYYEFETEMNYVGPITVIGVFIPVYKEGESSNKVLYKIEDHLRDELKLLDTDLLIDLTSDLDPYDYGFDNSTSTPNNPIVLGEDLKLEHIVNSHSVVRSSTMDDIDYMLAQHGKIVTHMTNLSIDERNSPNGLRSFKFKLAQGNANTIVIPELMVYNRKLSREERKSVEEYLATKYGIDLDGYIQANDFAYPTGYEYRRVAISHEHCQSQSTSLYDENTDELGSLNNDPQNWSRSLNRLMVVKAEDESIKICDQFGGGAFVCFDDNQMHDFNDQTSVESITFGSKNYVKIKRDWIVGEEGSFMKHNQNFNELRDLPWLNFDEMHYSNNIFETKYNTQVPIRYGQAATSRHMIPRNENRPSILHWDYGDMSKEYMIVGLASENYNFIKARENSYPFSYALLYRNNEYYIVWDSDFDGYTDQIMNITLSSTNVPIEIRAFSVDDKFYKIALFLGNNFSGFTEVHSFCLFGEISGGNCALSPIGDNAAQELDLYGKIIIEGNNASIKNVSGLGFESLEEGAVNLEFSKSKLGIMDEDARMYYLIYSGGGGPFNWSHPMNKTMTVNEYNDMLEASAVVIGNGSKFSVAYSGTRGLVYNQIEDCCGIEVGLEIDMGTYLLNIPNELYPIMVRVLNAENELMLSSNLDSLSASQGYYLGALDNGQYDVEVEFMTTNGDEINEIDEVEILKRRQEVDLNNFLPDTVVLDTGSVLLSPNIVEDSAYQYSYLWTGPKNFESKSREITIDEVGQYCLSVSVRCDATPDSMFCGQFSECVEVVGPLSSILVYVDDCDQLNRIVLPEFVQRNLGDDELIWQAYKLCLIDSNGLCIDQIHPKSSVLKLKSGLYGIFEREMGFNTSSNHVFSVEACCANRKNFTLYTNEDELEEKLQFATIDFGLSMSQMLYEKLPDGHLRWKSDCDALLVVHADIIDFSLDTCLHDSESGERLIRLIFDESKVENVTVYQDAGWDLYKKVSVLPYEDGGTVFKNNSGGRFYVKVKLDDQNYSLYKFNLGANISMALDLEVELQKILKAINAGVIEYCNPTGDFDFVYTDISKGDFEASCLSLAQMRTGDYSLRRNIGSCGLVRALRIDQVDETTFDFDLKYSNPIYVGSINSLRVELTEASTFEISIYNSSGQMLAWKKSKEELKSYEYGFSPKTTGMYYVRIESRGKEKVYKVVVH